MKSFTNFKRDIRTLYKPKSKGKRPDESLELEGNTTGATCDGPNIQLESVASTTARPQDTLTLANAESHTEPARDVAGIAQVAHDDYEHDASRNSMVSPSSNVPDVDDDAISTVEEGQANDDERTAGRESEDQMTDSEYDEPITFEEAQSLRDQLCIQFTTEAPEDFTDGPARIIGSADGVKRCAALLVPYDLSQKIQKALRGQHDFSRIQREGLFRRQSLLRLEDDVHREIFSCKARLCRLEDAGQMETEDAQKLGQQMGNLQLMLPDIGLRKQKASVDVDMHAKRLRNLQAAVNTHLEEAFICAHLIAPHEKGPEPEIEKLDVSQEYLKFCQRLEGPDDFVFEDVVVPLDNNRDHPELPPPSEEEQARQAVINNLWAAKEALDLAHQDFDNRENDRAREYEANVQAADRGENTTDGSPEAFDVRWVVQFRDLTRALIEAEAVYADVKRLAIEAGVPLPFTDNESVCGGVGDDTGYTISKEQELMASTPSPTVHKWLSKVPEGGETGSVEEESQLESDEWDAEEVGISDSVSLVAEGRQRSRIDRWQDACLAEKPQ